MAILKILTEAGAAAELPPQASLLETYEAFLLVEAEGADAEALAARYPAEDISDQYQLSLGGRTIDTLAWRSPARKRLLIPKLASSGLAPGPHHYVVQFIGPVKPGWQRGIRRHGVKLREHFKDFSFVALIPEDRLEAVAALDYVLWIGHLPPQDRLSPALAAAPAALAARGAPAPILPRRRVRPNVFTVELFDPSDSKRIAQAARTLGFDVLHADPKQRILMLESARAPGALRKQLKEMAAVHGVRYVRERVIPRTANDVATALMAGAAGALDGSFGLAGEGEVIAVCDTGLDTGDPATIHPDFADRIVAIKSYPITPDWSGIISNPGGNDGPADLDSGHGTHVAGSALGDGAAADGQAPIRGLAHRAGLVFQAIEQEMKWKPSAPAPLKAERYLLSGIPADLGPLFRYAYDRGARIHSDSWGGGDPGAYDEQCRQFDQFAWDHKDFCFVIAAGNDGSDHDGNGRINPGSVTSPATAKNCITVGACENRRPEFNTETYGEWWPQDFPADPANSDPMANDPDQVVAFSSRGPTADGRIKPEVVAPGTFILSTRSTRIAPNNFAWRAYPPNKQYFYMGGTSMATPLVAGALALIRQFLRTRHGIAEPSAALLKALLIAGAQRLPGGVGRADNHQGYGRVNLARTLGAVLLTIEGDGLATGELTAFTLEVPASGKTLRIVLAYTDAPGPALVNNLNLMVTDPSGKRWVGNQRSDTAALRLDSVNNVELVQRERAAKGNWRVEVVASNVSHGPQDFAIAAVLV